LQNTDLVQAFIPKNLNIFKICFLEPITFFTPNKYEKINNTIFIFIELGCFENIFLCDDNISKANLILSYFCGMVSINIKFLFSLYLLAVEILGFPGFCLYKIFY
jgi:hypothetical protein